MMNKSLKKEKRKKMKKKKIKFDITFYNFKLFKKNFKFNFNTIKKIHININL